ncbi:MAG TPA: serine hydrolase [Thermoanaerobaculia bacterium]|jgi:CubicO group peptidase (beta-lactamase class C family)
MKALVVALALAFASAAHAQSAAELAGLWEAKLRFGPDVRGPLTIAHDADGWRAEIAGRTATVTLSGERVTFDLGESAGSFDGRFDAKKTRIDGHWIQPRTATFGSRFATPLVLTKSRENLWRGEVAPLDDQYRFYIHIASRPDGSVGAFLRNPERNLQRRMRIASVTRDGSTLRFLDDKGALVSEAVMHDGAFSIYWPRYGGTYDFERAAVSDFYPREKPGAKYVYHPPRPRDDGWSVAAVEEVGISREGITRFIQMLVDTPMSGAAANEMHGVLIARHGKLVVEEYFHGEHADKLHDSRSAAKSLTATLVGAAMQSGVALAPSDSVYRVMGRDPATLEPRKRALTLEHLLTMTSGFFCDDNNPDAPGNEDRVINDDSEFDYYKVALDLPMESDPGTHPVYCSISAHLAGGVLQRAAGKPLPQLFQELIAGPMQMKRYAMNLTPAGDAYMGGGVRFLPRDFMKLAQMMMNGGTWNGRRIVSKEFAERASSPLVHIGKRGFGYFWWLDERPYRGRMIKTYMAGGNGGQIAMAVPELDLVIGFWGGNYSTGETFTAQNVYVPDWILPAVDEAH